MYDEMFIFAKVCQCPSFRKWEFPCGFHLSFLRVSFLNKMKLRHFQYEVAININNHINKQSNMLIRFNMLIHGYAGCVQMCNYIS